MAGIAIAVLVLDIVSKRAAEHWLQNESVQLGPLTLQLAFNPGVAFGLADKIPQWLLVVGLAAITAGIATYAWHSLDGRTGLGVALGAVLGGALANIIDRLPDGVVTDYLKLGWWPNFNFADAAITCGALVTVLLASRDGSGHLANDAQGGTGE